MKVLAIVAGCAVAVATAQAAETTCVSMCVEIYKPVCGSDGKTYSNECRFNYEKCSTKNEALTIVSEGECPESSACKKGCSKIYKAVCGSNGKTYSNECELNNAKCDDATLKLQSNGTCSGGSSSGSGGSGGSGGCTENICLADYAPVCGSDGKTYSNECKLNNAKCKDPSLTLQSQGECATMSPQTGSSGSSSMDDSTTTGPARSVPASTPTPAPSSSASTTSFTAVQIAASAALALATTLVL